MGSVKRRHNITAYDGVCVIARAHTRVFKVNTRTHIIRADGYLVSTHCANVLTFVCLCEIPYREEEWD